MLMINESKAGSMTLQFLVHLMFCSRPRYILMYDKSTLVVPLFSRMMDFVIEVVTLSKRVGVM